MLFPRRDPFGDFAKSLLGFAPMDGAFMQRSWPLPVEWRSEDDEISRTILNDYECSCVC